MEATEVVSTIATYNSIVLEVDLVLLQVYQHLLKYCLYFSLERIFSWFVKDTSVSELS